LTSDTTNKEEGVNQDTNDIDMSLSSNKKPLENTLPDTKKSLDPDVTLLPDDKQVDKDTINHAEANNLTEEGKRVHEYFNNLFKYRDPDENREASVVNQILVLNRPGLKTPMSRSMLHTRSKEDIEEQRARGEEYLRKLNRLDESHLDQRKKHLNEITSYQYNLKKPDVAKKEYKTGLNLLDQNNYDHIFKNKKKKLNTGTENGTIDKESTKSNQQNKELTDSKVDDKPQTGSSFLSQAKTLFFGK
jgi:hypothetical protein